MTVVDEPARLCELSLHELRVPRVVVVIDRHANGGGLLPVAVCSQRTYVGRQATTESEPVCREDDAELEVEPGFDQLDEVSGLTVHAVYHECDIFCRRAAGYEHLPPSPRC